MAELFFMAEARKRAMWEPHSMHMSLFANANRDPKKKAFSVLDFFPFDAKKPKKRDWETLPKAKITDLKYLFVDGVKNAPED